MILYGRNPVREALRGSRRGVQRVWATEAAQKSEDWLAEAAELHTADAAWIEERAGSADHQGICAEADGYPYADPGEPAGRTSRRWWWRWTRCRTRTTWAPSAAWPSRLGAAGVVIPERRAAEVTAAAAKASAGAVEHLPVARVRNLADWLAAAKDTGAWVYGAAAGPDAVPYDQPDYAGRVVLVLGSEGKGLRPRVAAACDQMVALPQRGRVGSLNVSTAAAALVYGILQLRT